MGKNKETLKVRAMKFVRLLKSKKVLIALLVAGVLTAAIGLTRAGTSYYSIEPENSTVSGAAIIKTDTNASGGKYIAFGSSGTTTNPTPTPSTNTGSTAITGTTYYLDCSGSDSADGKTTGTAWQSLAKADSASLVAGDGLLLKRGCSWSGGLNVKWNGVSGKPVVIGAYGSGSAPIITRNNNGSDITVVGSYTVIQDLNLTATAPSKDTTGSRCNGTPYGNIHGVIYEPGASYNVIKNSTISNMYAGVYLRADAHHNSVLNNNLTNNNMMSANRTGADDDAGAFGVLIWGHDNDIGYNTISGSNACSYDYEWDGAAIEIFGGASTPTSNNKIHHNKAINTNAFTELGKSSSGAVPSNNVYAYNTYYASGITNSIFMVTRGDTGSYGPISGTKAYNNTAYMTGTSKNGLYCGSCSASALTFKNNIIATNNSTPIPSNLGTGTSNNIGWVIGSGSNNPGFVNGAGQDFHLTSTSPAINAGVNEVITAGYNKDLDNKSVPAGSTVDIGAYEYGAVALNQQPSVLATLASGSKDISNKIFKSLKTSASVSIKYLISAVKNLGSLIAKPFKTEKAEAIQANGSIVVAAVGDMNPDNNTSTTSPSGKNASQIISGLGNGSIDYFFGLGDFQYQHGQCGPTSGTSYDLANVWGKLWAPVIPKMYTIAGPTHDSAGVTDDSYKKFFSGQCPGSTAKSAAVMSQGGTPIDALDFYSFDIGTWHFVALPTAAWRHDTTKANSITPQLDADLAKAKAAGKHLGALYHDPYFTGVTSSHGPETKVKPWIDVLSKYGVRLTLSGSQHNYERTCPVNNAGVCQTNGTGMTAFNVSTGGIGLRTFNSSPSYVEKKFTDTHGWLKLTLNTDGSFSWLFVSAGTGGTGSDSGSRAASGITGGGTTPTPTGDTTPPTVSISSPANGATVANTTQITANATDNSGSIKKLDLFLDGSTTVSQTITTSPYVFNLDTKTLTNGSHTITVKAYDNANNVGSTSVSVNVSNASCVAVPTTYGSVTTSMNLVSSGKYRIWSRIKAPDNTNNSYYIVVDNQCPINVGDKAITASSWTWVNNRDGGSTTIDMDLSAGAHTVKFIGKEPGVDLDRVLFVSNLSCIPSGTGDNCSVDSDTVVPSVSITSPTANQTLKGIVPLSVNATDNNGVAKVEYYLDAVATVPFATATTSPFESKFDSSQSSAGAHVLRAIAYDGAGNKSTEATVNVTVADQAKPTVSITSLVAGNISGSKEVTVNAGDNVGVTKVEVKLDNQVSLSTMTQPPYYFVWDSKTAPDGNHTLTAIATDAAGNIGSSQPILITVSNDTVVPSTPTDLKATQITASQIDLSWTASTDNKAVSGYNVYRGDAFLTSTSLPSYSDKSVLQNTTYNYRVSAVDAAGNESSKSGLIEVKTPSVGGAVPNAPSNLTGSLAGTSINLSWSAVSGITKYLIQRNGLIIGETATTSYVDSAILPGQTYTYVVYASSSTGVLSEASSSKSITTQAVTDTQAPSQPVNLVGTTSTSLINLTWDASTDNVGVAGYKIYRNDQQIATTTKPNFGDGTIEASKTYSYYVLAFDANGNQSEKSSTISLTIVADSGILRTGVVADSFVEQGKASENFGNWGSIRVDKSPKQNLLMKFSVNGTSGKVITSAKLRLYANNGSTRTGGSVYTLKTNSWEESKVTWNNAPGFNTDLIKKLGPVAKNSYVDIDLSSIVKGDGTYSLGFTSGSTDAAHYNSKEADSRKPELIITTN